MTPRLETIFREEVRRALGVEASAAAPANALALAEAVGDFLKTAPLEERQTFVAFLRGLFEAVQAPPAPVQASLEGLEDFRPSPAIAPARPAPRATPRAFRLTFPAPARAERVAPPKPAPEAPPTGDDVDNFAAASAAR